MPGVTSSFFPVVHSVLQPQALARVLEREYPCSSAVSVQLLRRNIGDTYLVRGLQGHECAILRVYRAGWRSRADVAWELQLLEHLAQAGLGVSRALSRRDGGLFSELNAPEGQRLYALFEFLPGRALHNTPEEAALYGRLAAKLHAAADHFPAGERFALDLNHLITQPMANLRPLLTDFPEQAEALEAIAERTDASLNALAPNLSWGPCHGDLHEVNARLHQGQVSVFDFDCGGPGYRAYDLAVYWWSQVTHSGKSPEESQAVWDAFLSAYQALRPLTEADLLALPHFVTARSLWFMGLMAGRVQEFGTETLGQPFFDFGVDFMREWQKKKQGKNLL